MNRVYEVRLGRILTPTGPQYAVSQDGAWLHIEDPFAAILSYTGQATPTHRATLLAPVTPTSIVGVGHNPAESNNGLPIQAWHKSVRTLADPEDKIRVRRGDGAVIAEGELAVVIGKRSTELTYENAREHILGYTIANDVTNVDQALIDERLFQAKAGEKYTPLGPWIETTIGDPDDLAITVTLNGEAKVQSGTFNLPSSVVDCLIYVTRWVTLDAGDVVMTGAPGTSLAVRPGDSVGISINGIGTLANSVI
ncbi:Fumarylacetoacetate hydrolase [Arthrobacter sp. 9V]|nr:Fumarylacetoacetate hydrolase [Arthrobacter sp. 9V]